MNHQRSRRLASRLTSMRGILLLALAVMAPVMGIAITPSVIRATPPQPLPPYAAAPSLRGDSSLHAVAFSPDPSGPVGITVGDRGTILRSIDQGQSWRLVLNPVDSRLDDVVWISPQTVVAVGGAYDALTQLSRGIVLISQDAGEHWQTVDRHDLARLRSLELRKDRSLIVTGDWSHGQLAQQFVSRDGGRTWQGLSELDHPPSSENRPAANASSATTLMQWRQVTGSLAPIRDACRVSRSRLCAVGDHGVIFTSDDEGDTWQPVRGERRHTAILFIARDAASVPWLLLGSESLRWRNRSSLLLENPSTTQARKVHATDLARQATMMLGGSSADEFQTPREKENQDEKQADRQAQRWIAIHRPTVVVIDESVSAETQEAFLQAATSAGVPRVLKSSSGNSRSSSSSGALLHHHAMLPRLGLMAGDMTLDALHLVAPRRCVAPSVSTSRLYDAGSRMAGGGGSSLVTGLPLQEGTRLVAEAKSISRHRLQVVQARTKQTQQIERLIATAPTTAAFQGTLHLMLDQTAAEDQMRLAWSIHQQTRNTPLETASLSELSQRFSGHSLGHWAKVVKQARNNSQERIGLRSPGLASADPSPPTQAAPAITPVSPFQNMSHAGANGGGVQQASALFPVGVSQRDLMQASFSPANRKKTTTHGVDLQFDFHPAVMLARLASDESTEDQDTGVTPTGVTPISVIQTGDLARIVDQGQSPWRSLLRSPSGFQIDPAMTVQAHPTPTRPQLDASWDDSCWNFAPSIVHEHIQLKIAFDDQYIYVAAQCPANLLSSDPVASPSNQRHRDQSIDGVDRLRLRFDTDADLWTSHSLEITDAGRTRDRTDGDPAWQPTWYFDTQRNEQSVTFEIAIRRSDLNLDTINNDHSWFISAEILNSPAHEGAGLFPDPTAWTRLLFP